MEGALSRTGHILRLQNFVILSQKLPKTGGSNRNSAKSGNNCGKLPSKRFAFPLNNKPLHQPTCHLRLRHLAFFRQFYSLERVEKRRFFALRRPHSFGMFLCPGVECGSA